MNPLENFAPESTMKQNLQQLQAGVAKIASMLSKMIANNGSTPTTITNVR
jgi:hypothetical protein